jgi:hypothetical protein
MRIARKMRKLSGAETSLATRVFGDSLPSFGRIMITDGLGPIPGYDNPYTEEKMGLFFLNLGPEVYANAIDTSKYYSGYGRYDAIFIHEMTHVWQYDKGYWVVLRSLWANTAGAGYNYTPGAPWDDYNVEQQAQIVEDWYKAGMSPTDARFVYIDKIIRPGIGNGLVGSMIINLPVDTLKNL